MRVAFEEVVGFTHASSVTELDIVKLADAATAI